MKNTHLAALVIAASTVAFAGSLAAKPALKDVAHVRDGIIATGMAFELSEKCSTLSPRRIRGINYLYSLRSHAFDLGYSRAEVDAYINDKSEENRLKQVAYARLAALGTQAGNEASYCAVGRAEIAKQSAIGNLLR